MAPQPVTETQEVLQTPTKYRFSSNNTRRYHQTLHQDVERPGLTQGNCNNELLVDILNLTVRDSHETIQPRVSTNTIFDSLLHRGRNSQILSPPPSVSTVSSLGSASSVEDSPRTPCRGLNHDYSIAASTPVTPPTTRSMTRKQNFGLTTPPSSAIASTIFDKVEGRILRQSHGWIEEKGRGQDQDDFVPKKLIRGLTAEFTAIAEANAVAAHGRYNSLPMFNFACGPTARISSTPRSTKSRTQRIQEDDNAKVAVEVRSTAATLKNYCIPQNRSLCTDLEIRLEHIIPWNVHVKLKEDQIRCVASLVKDRQVRCKNKARGTLTSVDEGFQRLAQNNNDQDYPVILDHIKKLVQTIQCGSHINSASSRLDQVRGLGPSLAQISSEERVIISDWIRAIANPEVPENLQQDEPQSRVELVSPKSSTAQTAHTTLLKPERRRTVMLSYALSFSPYQPKWQARLSVKEALLSVISDPLKPTDEKAGFIYIFWDFAHFGMVKIGRTKDLAQRLKQWNKQCKREHGYQGELPQIPHASRIERLIHIELKKYRMQRECEGCGTNHEEWFNVSGTHAVKVFEKWQKWIEQRPYALDSSTKQWTLRSEMQDTLNEICEPVPDVQETRQQMPRRKSGGVGGRAMKRPSRKTV